MENKQIPSCKTCKYCRIVLRGIHETYEAAECFHPVYYSQTNVSNGVEEGEHMVERGKRIESEVNEGPVVAPDWCPLPRSMQKQNAAQVLQSFLWKNMPSLQIISGSLHKGFEIDQKEFLQYLMHFQEWLYRRQSVDTTQEQLQVLNENFDALQKTLELVKQAAKKEIDRLNSKLLHYKSEIERHSRIPIGYDDWCEVHKRYYKDKCSECCVDMPGKTLTTDEIGKNEPNSNAVVRTTLRSMLFAFMEQNCQYNTDEYMAIGNALQVLRPVCKVFEVYNARTADHGMFDPNPSFGKPRFGKDVIEIDEYDSIIKQIKS